MTKHATFDSVAISDKRLVLATDLDGTFLGGSQSARENFYAWIEAHRSEVGLIFVTGRDPEFIEDLTLNQGVPRPEFVIGDVGTTIANVDANHRITPISALEREIASAWGDASEEVRRTLAGKAGLTEQPTPFRFRVSYDMDPTEFDEDVFNIVWAMGLDAIVSDNRFFDVLPKGVSKGPSLLRLLAHLGVDHSRVLVAGDTLNDMSMLELGLPAVAVGGSEPALVEQLSGQDHVHAATGIGVDGIAEAITVHKLFHTAERNA